MKNGLNYWLPILYTVGIGMLGEWNFAFLAIGIFCFIELHNLRQEVKSE